jgi:DNA ligase-1
VISESGLEKGKKVRHEYKAEPKNIGRSNETTASQQAILEVQAAYRDALTNGKYSESIKKANVFKPLPMLAKQFEDHKDKLPPKVIIQPKLDGVRCMCIISTKQMLLRNGRELDLPVIKEELKTITWGTNLVLDGEIYLHGKSLQQIMSMIHSKDESLEYHVFDAIELDNINESYNDRSMLTPASNHEGAPHIKTVDEYFIDTDQVENLVNRIIKEGYEGIMIRNPEGKYKWGKRSSDLLKYKLFQDDEFEITGYYYGKGVNENIVTWTCKTKDGKKFNVLQEGTHEEKRAIKPKDCLGKMLTVKYQNLTDDGIPRFPVGKGIREDI